MRRTLPGQRPQLAAVVLAAGASSRLGRSKQLFRFRGVPLLVRATRLALSRADGPVIVVLGADALRLRSCLRRRSLAARVVYNGRWSGGMSGSLRAGLCRVPRKCAGVLVLLTDQVLLAPAELGRLVERWRRQPGRPAAALSAGRSGAPAILPRRLLRAARTIRGDQGARQLLRGLAAVTTVPVPSAAYDLDTPADAAAISAVGKR
jgi:molybdenum cofactor cytidylyltransferase